MFVGTAELTRLQDPNCALRSEIPEIFKRRDGTRAETRFRLSAKRMSPFKLAGGISSVDYSQPRCAYQQQ